MASKTPAQQYLASVKRRPAKSEHCLQRAIVKWCRGAYGAGMVCERFAAIPNGGTRGATPKDRMIAGAMLKAEGVRAGMPDLIFWKPYDVLWLEVKLGTSGRISPAQAVVHQSLTDNDLTVVIARDIGEAIKAITEFYA